jgi:Domain of unknown function (DUF1330)
MGFKYSTNEVAVLGHQFRIESARAWYRSPAYGVALEVRDQALSRNLILVDPKLNHRFRRFQEVNGDEPTNLFVAKLQGIDNR